MTGAFEHHALVIGDFTRLCRPQDAVGRFLWRGRRNPTLAVQCAAVVVWAVGSVGAGSDAVGAGGRHCRSVGLLKKPVRVRTRRWIGQDLDRVAAPFDLFVIHQSILPKVAELGWYREAIQV